MPIVLQRYAGSRYGPRKQTQPLNIQAGMTVCLPVFAEYQVSFVIEHVGPSLSSGHYRTFLSGCHPLRQWVYFLADDESFPALTNQHDLQQLAHNSYVIGLTRSDAFISGLPPTAP